MFLLYFIHIYIYTYIIIFTLIFLYLHLYLYLYLYFLNNNQILLFVLFFSIGAPPCQITLAMLALA